MKLKVVPYPDVKLLRIGNLLVPPRCPNFVREALDRKKGMNR